MTIASVTPVAIPALVFLMMIVVGMELLPADFSRVRERPQTVLVGTVGQLLLLPLLAILLGWVLNLPPSITAGMMLVAACPGGAISNYYALLARADVALSVSLTAVSTLLAPFTLPLIADSGFQLIAANASTPSALAGDHAAISLPVISTMLQLLIMLVIPIATGMWLRRRWPHWANAHGAKLRTISLLALLSVMTFIAWQQPERLLEQGSMLLLAGASFTLLSLAVGIGVAMLIHLPAAARFTFGIEHAARNLGVAAAVGAGILGDTGMVLFATALLIIQIPLLLAASLLQRR